MARVRVVTDSSATFEDPRLVSLYDITVVPLNLHFGDRVLRDGVDIDAEEMFHRLRRSPTPPSVSAPSVGAFAEVFQNLSRSTDQICVVLHSQHFTETYSNALTARNAFLGRCEIAVIDSRTTSAALGYLVEATAEAASAGASLDEVVHLARSLIPRLYSVFYVDTLEYIQQANLIGETQAILGTMLQIKPLLTIEDGLLITMEKARTHAQAIDKMIEFVAEFTDIERLCILQSTLRVTDRTRMLQDRLALEFARLQSPLLLYTSLLATRIGPDGIGMAILEGTGRDD